MLLLNQTPPEDFDSWVANAFYVVALVTALVVLFQRLRAAPRSTTIEGQPVVVAAAAEFATTSQHAELKRKVDGLSQEIKDGFAALDAKRSDNVRDLYKDVEASVNGLRKEVREDVVGLHTRLNDVTGAVREMAGQLKELNKK